MYRRGDPLKFCFQFIKYLCSLANFDCEIGQGLLHVHLEVLSVDLETVALVTAESVLNECSVFSNNVHR